MKLIFKMMLPIFLLFTIQEAIGQKRFFAGEVHLENGTILNGLTEIPSIDKDQSIKFKKDLSSQVVTLNSSNIKKIKIPYFDSLYHIFKYTQFEKFKKKNNTFKRSKSKKWLYLNYKTEHMNVYSSTREFTMNIDMKMELTGFVEINFYVEKTKVGFPVLAYQFQDIERKSQNQYLIACLSYFLRDTPKLEKNIKAGKYNWERLYEIAETYSWSIRNNQYIKTKKIKNDN